jgi:hypothetical protein
MLYVAEIGDASGCSRAANLPSIDSQLGLARVQRFTLAGMRSPAD